MPGLTIDTTYLLGRIEDLCDSVSDHGTAPTAAIVSPVIYSKLSAYMGDASMIYGGICAKKLLVGGYTLTVGVSYMTEDRIHVGGMEILERMLEETTGTFGKNT